MRVWQEQMVQPKIWRHTGHKCLVVNPDRGITSYRVLMPVPLARLALLTSLYSRLLRVQ